MSISLPGLKRRLVVVGISELDMLSDLHRHGGGVLLLEPLPQRRRRHLRRRSTAAGGHELVRRRHYGAAEHTQHFDANFFIFLLYAFTIIFSRNGIQSGARIAFYRGM